MEDLVPFPQGLVPILPFRLIANQARKNLLDLVRGILLCFDFSLLESPRQSRKFNAFSAFGDTLEVADTRSGRVSPLIFSMNDDELSSSVEIKTESTCDEG